MILTKKVVPRPCFKKTANGGSKMFKIMVSKDITVQFFVRFQDGEFLPFGLIIKK